MIGDVDTSELGETTNDELPAGGRYYEYVLIHVDNLMVDIRREEHAMKAIIKIHQLKKDNKMGLTYGPTEIYLGKHIDNHQEPQDDVDSFCYNNSGDHYVKNVVSNFQKKFMDHGK